MLHVPRFNNVGVGGTLILEVLHLPTKRCVVVFGR